VPHLRDGLIVDKPWSPTACWWSGTVGIVRSTTAIRISMLGAYRMLQSPHRFLTITTSAGASTPYVAEKFL
jgi:hypothetical protein